MSCTLEKKDVGGLGCDELTFGSLNEVINVEQKGCNMQSKGGFDQDKKMLHNSVESA